MQPTNQRKLQRSRCVYCESTSYGKGCRFGPHGVHFHPEDTSKCSFCGSTNYGKGCKINPTSNLHIHGLMYNNMFKESVQSFLDHKVLLNELKKNFVEFECFKLGIIDEHGNKIKVPITEHEKASFSPMTKTIVRLKKYLGSKIDLLEVTEALQTSASLYSEGIEYYEKVLVYQGKLDEILNNLYETLDRAHEEGIALEDIKELLKA